jgi:TonB-linked SusC/RagA family outer membrane protein
MKKCCDLSCFARRRWKKITRVMKLTTLLLLFVVLAASAGSSYSQTARINLKMKDATIVDIFREIERTSDFGFFFKNEEIDLSQKVSIDLKNVSIEEVLKKVLDNEYSYRIIDNNIVVLRENTNTSVQQRKSVSGKVSDPSGSSVPGASIVVKGTTNGTITDGDGKYSLSNVPENAILQVSFVGMKMQEVAVEGKTSINVTLEDEAIGIEEVVAIGYGTQKKSDVTGALIRVSEEELQSRPVGNIIQAMQGKAAGVDITSNERPGEKGDVYIRGVRSLTASNSPLYVVDGIPLMSSSGIETMSPSDIESIDILKDASATAIYGSRGANGVILVTTKKGKSGKLTLNYSGTVTIETIQDRTKMMTADEYITWRRWAYYYADPVNNPRGDQPTQAKDNVFFLGARDPNAWANIMKGWAGGIWDGSKVETTDWNGMVTQTGVSTEHNISASGGTDKMKAYCSFGYLNTEGTMKGQTYTRYTSKTSIDLNPVKWFEMGINLNTTYSLQQFGLSNAGGMVSGPGSIYAAANNNLPFAVPFDANGNRIDYPGGDDGIKTAVNEWEYTDNQRNMFRTMGSIYAQINILPGLRYRVNFGPDFRYYTNGLYIDSKSVNRLNAPNYASLRNEKDFSWTLDNLLYYDKKIGKHTFGATLLQTSSSWVNDFSYMQAKAIPFASQKWNALNMTNIPALDSWDSGLTERQLMSYMGRVNYGFTDKYLLTLSGRWDGASQLSEGHKWAFFPSAALAWRMDQEEWLKSIEWISQMKVRLGMGTTGNSAIIPYQTKGGVVSLFYPYGASGIAGYVPSESLIKDGNLPLANPNLGWEMTTQYNLGIDFSLWKGRVSGVIDIYTSHTKDLLLQMSIPALTGYTITYSNVGETKNMGIDMTLNTINVKTKDFTWETNLNAAWQKDQIVSLSNGKSDDISNLWFIDQPISVVYGYESNGLWKEEDAAEMAKFNANGHKFSAGKARPADLNGDYKIDPNNDRKIIGNTRPRWTVGMTNTFTYKNFDLSFFLYGRLKYLYNTGGEWQGGRYIQRSINYYNENNKNSEYQKPVYDVAGGDPYFNILGYRDGSFIKIRNINLGYNFPKSITSKLGLQTLKVYAQVKNPGMLYSKIDWLDMDLSTSGNGTTNNPTVSASTWNRGFVFGVNVGF